MINYQKHRFYTYNVHKRDQFKMVEIYTRYSYDSKNKLYDVDVRNSDGSVSFHINCKEVETPDRVHFKIAEHFGLKNICGSDE